MTWGNIGGQVKHCKEIEFGLCEQLMLLYTVAEVFRFILMALMKPPPKEQKQQPFRSLWLKLLEQTSEDSKVTSSVMILQH